MRCFRALALRLCLVSLLGALPTAAWALSLGEKAGLQAAMQRHIDRQMVDGVFPYLDPASGQVRALHPVTAHPMILKMDRHYVLCFDFRDDRGNDVEVDFYLARKDASFVVFHTAIGNRELLQRLMRDGKVGRAE